MSIHRFLHNPTQKFLALYMPNPPYHDNNKDNRLIAVSAEDSNKYNSNWQYNSISDNNSADYKTKIYTSKWRIEDQKLNIAVMGSIPINYEFPLGASSEKSSEFYFKPKISDNGKQYYQICTLIGSMECCITLNHGNDSKEYSAAIIEITPQNNDDPNTFFSKEPAI
ncbi:hypothetical protein [Paenochrobactrum glaciei]|uniref:Uncharacterized protein n=1 Tax=Paenochrobactrum glaciei TaxID=486407 RepID=A0ABN1GES1_9HYPH